MKFHLLSFLLVISLFLTSCQQEKTDKTTVQPENEIALTPENAASADNPGNTSNQIDQFLDKYEEIVVFYESKVQQSELKINDVMELSKKQVELAEKFESIKREETMSLEQLARYEKLAGRLLVVAQNIQF